MNILREALKARRFFPLAPREQAAKQAVAYAKARAYLHERNLHATSPDSDFVYQPMLAKVP